MKNKKLIQLFQQAENYFMSAFSLEFLSQELAKSSFFESSQGIAMFLKLNDSEFSISNDPAIKILLNNKKLDD